MKGTLLIFINYVLRQRNAPKRALFIMNLNYITLILPEVTV